jgi:hypothetical protein
MGRSDLLKIFFGINRVSHAVAGGVEKDLMLWHTVHEILSWHLIIREEI